MHDQDNSMRAAWKIFIFVCALFILSERQLSASEYISGASSSLNNCYKLSVSGSALTATPDGCADIQFYTGVGNNWQRFDIFPATMTLSGLSSGNYHDIFAYRSGNATAIRAGPAWASSSSRGSGTGTTQIQLQNGRRVNSVSLSGSTCPALRCLYVGTVLASGAAAATSVPNILALADLGTGLVKNTTGTGIPSIAVAGVDYLVPGSALTGSGTSGKLPKWTSSTALGDSILTESGTTVTAAGSIVAGGFNSLTIAPSTASNPVTLTASGSDAEISLHLKPKVTAGFPGGYVFIGDPPSSFPPDLLANQLFGNPLVVGGSVDNNTGDGLALASDNGVILQFYTVGGSHASPTTVSANHPLGVLSFKGFNGSTQVYKESTSIDIDADGGLNADGSVSSHILIRMVPPTGGTRQQVARISSNGVFTLNSLTASKPTGTNASKDLVSLTTTGSGDSVLATAPTLVTPTIAKLANLTSNGFVKTSGSDGTLSVDTASYLPSTGGTITGDLTITKQDPSIIFNAGQTSDTKFWLGVQDDNGNDDDDKFHIGSGATPGSNIKVTLDPTSGQFNLGLGLNTYYQSDVYQTAAGSLASTASVRGISMQAGGGAPGIYLGANSRLSWSSNQVGSGDASANSDLTIYRDAADTFAQRRTTTAQKSRLYNTFTTVNTEGEWFKQDWVTTANQIRIGAAKGSSTGTARVMSIDYGGTEASPVAAITIPITSGHVVFGGGIKLPAPLSAISTGSAAITGNAVLVGGTVTVNTTAALTGSSILLTRKTSGGTIGTSITYTITNATSFTINSDNILDTSTFTWVIIDSY